MWQVSPKPQQARRRRSLTRIVGSILAITPQVACSRDGLDSSIQFQGPITAESVHNFAELVSDPKFRNAQWVEITSAGGDAFAGMEMGRVIRARHLGVRVLGFCVSACAQYVFLAARKRHVEPGGLVLFHNNLGMIKKLHGDGGDHEGSEVFAPLVAQEDAFMAEIGARQGLTAMSIDALRPVCFLVDETKTVGNPKRYGFAANFVAFGIPKSTVEGMTGVPVTGYWPMDRNQMMSSLGALPFHPSFTVNWLPDSRPSFRNRKSAYRLPRCPPTRMPQARK